MERNSNTPYSIGDYFIRPTSEFYSSFGKDSIFANDINYTNNSIFFVGDRVCTPFAPLSSKGNED
jgi:hypothetical protein